MRTPLSARRLAIVQKAFLNFDRSKTGSVDIRNLKQEFRADSNPLVIDGRSSVEEMTSEFCTNFDEHHSLYGGYSVSLQEFVEFYADVSSCIDSDDYFVALVTASWLSNTSNFGY